MPPVLTCLSTYAVVANNVELLDAGAVGAEGPD